MDHGNVIKFLSDKIPMMIIHVDLHRNRSNGLKESETHTILYIYNLYIYIYIILSIYTIRTINTDNVLYEIIPLNY